MQSIRAEKSNSGKACAVCEAVITELSPINDLCKGCFEKEVVLTRLIEYLQNADAKKLNIIQSYPIQNIFLQGSPSGVLHRERPASRVCMVEVSTGVEYELTKFVTVFGRSAEKADCVIQNSAMSGNHAAVIKENNTFYIQDNNSSNGTWVNDRRLKPNVKCALFNKDRIRFANENMIFIVK